MFRFVYCSCKSCSFVKLWLVARALEYGMRSIPSLAFQSSIVSNVSFIIFYGLIRVVRQQKCFTLDLLSVEDMPYIFSNSVHRNFVLQGTNLFPCEFALSNPWLRYGRLCQLGLRSQLHSPEISGGGSPPCFSVLRMSMNHNNALSTSGGASRDPEYCQVPTFVSNQKHLRHLPSET